MWALRSTEGSNPSPSAEESNIVNLLAVCQPSDRWPGCGSSSTSVSERLICRSFIPPPFPPDCKSTSPTACLGALASVRRSTESKVLGSKPDGRAQSRTGMPYLERYRGRSQAAGELPVAAPRRPARPRRTSSPPCSLLRTRLSPNAGGSGCPRLACACRPRREPAAGLVDARFDGKPMLSTLWLSSVARHTVRRHGRLRGRPEIR